MDCIFCKILNKEIDTEFVYEGDICMAFNDINPKANTHVLIVPKKHVESVMTLADEDRDIVADMIFTAKKIGEDKGLEGYQLRFHVGEKGGQEIPHIHLHLLADT
jgi:histidine triad (HIT) family protein